MDQEVSLLLPSGDTAQDCAGDRHVSGQHAERRHAEGLKHHDSQRHEQVAPTWLEAKFRDAVIARLRTLVNGQLHLLVGGERYLLGQTAEDGLSAEIHVHHCRMFRRIALGGSMAAAESYMDGDWSTPDLTNVVRLMIRNSSALSSLDSAAGFVVQPLLRWWHARQENNEAGSRRNIAAHYDLGNEFFSSWLDESMAYSSAIYEHASSTLAEAQTHKFKRICEKLDLKPSDHLLEIGCGWGGLAIYAAKHFGCRVTGITISQRQFDVATERVNEAGLSDRVSIVLQDYRKMTGSFDKLVSIEMIEAVGHQWLDTYFATCSKLLKPNGLALIQGITLADQLHRGYLRSVDFIQRYIFPGGCLPSIESMATSVCRATDLRIFHLEDAPQHYARTLADWRKNFFAVMPRLREMNLGDEFLRMWEYYLCYCEGGFREQQLGLVQLLLIKPENRRTSLASSAVV